MSNYEAKKRGNRMRSIREQAAALGVTLRPSGRGWYAMVGTMENGSVVVWDELTGRLTEIAGPGTVDVANLPPEPGTRGRKAAPGQLGFVSLLERGD